MIVIRDKDVPEGRDVGRTIDNRDFDVPEGRDNLILNFYLTKGKIYHPSGMTACCILFVLPGLNPSGIIVYHFVSSNPKKYFLSLIFAN